MEMTARGRRKVVPQVRAKSERQGFPGHLDLEILTPPSDIHSAHLHLELLSIVNLVAAATIVNFGLVRSYIIFCNLCPVRTLFLSRKLPGELFDS